MRRIVRFIWCAISTFGIIAPVIEIITEGFSNEDALWVTGYISFLSIICLLLTNRIITKDS